MSGRAASPSWWVAGDWNGFFGLFTNVALNVIVLTGLCLGVVKLPEDIVFGRVLPALGIALPIGNLFYAWLAWQVARREGRSDVTALPYGPSVPHRLLGDATYIPEDQRPDPRLAGRSRLGVHHRHHHPARCLRWPDDPQIHAARGDAGCVGHHLDRVHLDASAALSWEVPWLAFISLGIILVSWTARVACPGGCLADWRQWRSVPCLPASPRRQASAR
jgi:AGZA family xanthine/uracil permease-like MFS transporter